MRVFEAFSGFWAHSVRNPTLKAANSGQHARYRHLAKKIIAEGIKTGHFRKCDSSRVASSLIGVIEGYTIQWLFDEKAFDLANAQKMTEEMVMGYLRK